MVQSKEKTEFVSSPPKYPVENWYGGWFKVNVDGAYKIESGKAGIGVIIRDSGGQVVAISDSTLKSSVVVITEALTVKGRFDVSY